MKKQSEKDLKVIEETASRILIGSNSFGGIEKDAEKVLNFLKSVPDDKSLYLEHDNVILEIKKEYSASDIVEKYYETKSQIRVATNREMSKLYDETVKTTGSNQDIISKI